MGESSTNSVGEGPNPLAAGIDLIVRPKLLAALIGYGSNPFSPGGLSRNYGIPKSTTTVYLRMLLKGGVIRKVLGLDGRRSYYIITDFGMRALEEARKWLITELRGKCGDSSIKVRTQGLTPLRQECLNQFLNYFGPQANVIAAWLGVEWLNLGDAYGRVPAIKSVKGGRR